MYLPIRVNQFKKPPATDRLFILIRSLPAEYKSIIKSKIKYDNILEKENALKEIDMVFVEGGSFQAGDPEEVVKEVKVHDFYISTYEITNEQFCHFLNIYGSDTVKTGEFIGREFSRDTCC